MQEDGHQTSVWQSESLSWLSRSPGPGVRSGRQGSSSRASVSFQEGQARCAAEATGPCDSARSLLRCTLGPRHGEAQEGGLRRMALCGEEASGSQPPRQLQFLAGVWPRVHTRSSQQACAGRAQRRPAQRASSPDEIRAYPGSDDGNRRDLRGKAASLAQATRLGSEKRRLQPSEARSGRVLA